MRSFAQELDRIFPPNPGERPATNSSDPGKPIVHGVGFFPSNKSHHNVPPHAPARDTNLHVVLPAVGCFCFGILIASIIGIALYTKQVGICIYIYYI